MKRNHLFFAAAVMAAGYAGAQTEPAQPPFVSEPPAPERAEALARTPKIDGILAPGEWAKRASANGVDTYIHWESGWLYIGVQHPRGQALLVSVDGSADGWLKGADNLDIQILPGRAANPSVRILDNRGSLPVWTPSPILSAAVRAAAGQTGETDFVEIAIPSLADDGFVFEPGRTVGVRVDAIDPTTVDRQPFEPRLLAAVPLVQDWLWAPNELKWKVDWSDRLVSVGDTITVNVELQNDGVNLVPLKAVTFSGDGGAEPVLNYWVNKQEPMAIGQRVRTEFKSKLPRNTPIGAHIVNFVAELEDGTKIPGQTSFTVAEPVVVKFNLRSQKITLDGRNRFKGEVWVEAHTQKGMGGNLVLIAPPGWTIVSGERRAFNFPRTRMRLRHDFEIEAPAGTTGAFNLRAQASLSSGPVTASTWIQIVPSGQGR